jgi:Arc/MetJ family transcription regulator
VRLPRKPSASPRLCVNQFRALGQRNAFCYWHYMKNVQITLPDDLARDAAEAGLLSGDNLEQLLRDAVKTLRKSNLRKAMDRMAETSSGPAMSPEEVAAEIAKFRAERRADPSAH